MPPAVRRRRGEAGEAQYSGLGGCELGLGEHAGVKESYDLLQRGSEGARAHAGPRRGSGGVLHRRRRLVLAANLDAR